MLKKSKKRERRERETAILAEPEAINHFLDHIVGGGSLLSYSKLKEIRYRRLYGWVHEDENNLKLYAQALEARANRYSDMVLASMAETMSADIRQLYDAAGNMLPANQLPDSMARVVGSIEEEESEKSIKRKAKLDSRQGAREQLGRHLGLFKDNLQLGGELKLKGNVSIDVHFVSPEGAG